MKQCWKESKEDSEFLVEFLKKSPDDFLIPFPENFLCTLMNGFLNKFFDEFLNEWLSKSFWINFSRMSEEISKQSMPNFPNVLKTFRFIASKTSALIPVRSLRNPLRKFSF